MNDVISRITLKKTRFYNNYSSLSKLNYYNSPVGRKKSKKTKKYQNDNYTASEKIDNGFINLINNDEVSKNNYKYIYTHNNEEKNKYRFKKNVNPFSKKYVKNRKRICNSVNKFINDFKSSYMKK